MNVKRILTVLTVMSFLGTNLAAAAEKEERLLPGTRVVGAIVTMVAINSAVAVVSMHNMRNAKLAAAR